MQEFVAELYIGHYKSKRLYVKKFESCANLTRLAISDSIITFQSFMSNKG